MKRVGILILFIALLEKILTLSLHLEPFDVFYKVVLNAVYFFVQADLLQIFIQNII